MVRSFSLSRHGAVGNKNNGIYILGESYGFARKRQVAVEIEIQKVADQQISINAIAKQCHVSWVFVNKVNNEMIEHGRVLRSSEIYVRRGVICGPIV